MDVGAVEPLKIAILGYGKMGKMVERMAAERGHKISSIRKTKGQFVDLTACDVIIDFSTGDSILSHIEEAGEAKKNIVIGTTGWDEEIPKVKLLLEKYQIGALYSPNFSIGVHLFLKVLKEASSLYVGDHHYAAAGVEIHHQEKKDAPSGTSKAMRDIIQFGGRFQMPEFASVRVGKVPGTHTIYFDSEEDTVTLTHTAKGREGFAHGAIVAAEWLKGKTGFFTLEDIL
jgi:4-hydroxy-tetrahydrodipicolinate reductase